MRTAIITDTNSGISQEQAEKYDIKLLPMPFSIGGEDYLEGVDLTVEEFLEKQAKGMDISTSQPSPLSVMQLWDELLENYDNILHIPMSSALSNSWHLPVKRITKVRYMWWTISGSRLPRSMPV